MVWLLQIISGKFYGNGEIRHNQCRGVLYSNADFFSSTPIKLGNIEIDSVDWSSGLPTYVISYDNALEITKQTEILVKIGDYQIVEQLKYIISFATNAIFDENESIVERLCRKGNRTDGYPSTYVTDTFDTNRNLKDVDWKQCQDFYAKVIGLPRSEYKVIIKCLAAYNSSFMVFQNDFSLAYSILIYVLETLSANFDGYSPTWDDYNQDVRRKLDDELSKIDESIAKNIREILISESHLKLSKRFSNFILQYVNIDYYNANINHQITEDELKRAIHNAYIIRSKYAHELKSVMAELKYASLEGKSEVFTWYHETYLTYSGLLRLTRTVIYNFVNSRESISTEAYEWYNDLPGTIKAPIHPKYWLGKNIDIELKRIPQNFEAFINILVNDSEMPQINSLIENYADHINNISQNNKHLAYVMCWIYVEKVTGIDDDFKSRIVTKLQKYKDLEKQCNIATIIGNLFIHNETMFNVGQVVQSIEEYNIKKFKQHNVKLPTSLESRIYIDIANNYNCVGHKDDAIKWYEKAYKNSTNDGELQKMIKEVMKELR